MKNLLSILILLIPVFTFAKEGSYNKDSRFFISIRFTLDYTYRHLSTQPNKFTPTMWYESNRLMDSIYRPKAGYTAGFGIGYKLTKRIEVETGLYLGNRGLRSIPIFTTIEKSAAWATHKISFIYQDIPLRFNYYFINNRKINAFVTTGIVMNIPIRIRAKAKAVFDEPDFTGRYSYIYRQNLYNYSPLLGFGLKKKISNKIDLLFQATASYQMRPENTMYLTYVLYGILKTEHLWRAGAGFSCNIKL